ncbi:hypothetical protein D3C71_1977300 [compost metagenome]
MLDIVRPRFLSSVKPVRLQNSRCRFTYGGRDICADGIEQSARQQSVAARTRRLTIMLADDNQVGVERMIVLGAND